MAIKTYASFFSGIGGLEASTPAASFCEIDSRARLVLSKRFPGAAVHEDIRRVKKVNCDVVAGGWPCQDISIAGHGKGLKGENSGLFYELLRVAKASKVETVVAENVSNVLRLEGGKLFREVVREFFEAGFVHIAWRSINAREFGLPHHRNRVFFVASKDASTAKTIFRQHKSPKEKKKVVSVSGFYWTAGTHSINYSRGYVPTIKVGSALSIPSPPAVHYRDIVRLLTPAEAMRLQGVDMSEFPSLGKGDIYRMAGNAVAVPVGRFVMDGVLLNLAPESLSTIGQYSIFGDSFLDGEGVVPPSGYFDGGFSEVAIGRGHLATNLADFVDMEDTTTISARAASGLLSRIDRSTTPIPDSLRADLERLANA